MLKSQKQRFTKPGLLLEMDGGGKTQRAKQISKNYLLHMLLIALVWILSCEYAQVPSLTESS